MLPSRGPDLEGGSDWFCWEDGCLADLRRNTPEPPLGRPKVQMRPGLADEMMRELAPLLAEDGVDIVRLPAGHWFGERAAVNVLALAREGRAFQSLGSLITRQGSHQLLAGSALALAAVVRAWSRSCGTPIGTLLPAVIR